MPITELFSLTSDPNSPSTTYITTNASNNNVAVFEVPLSKIKVEFCTHDTKCGADKFLNTTDGLICVHINKT
jgi:hypothetical protein